MQVLGNMCNGSGGGAMITATGAFLEVSRGWYANNSVVTGYGAGLSVSLDLSGVRRGGWYSGLYEKVVRGACGTDSFLRLLQPRGKGCSRLGD